MPTVDELLAAYRTAYAAGEAVDPQPYLDQLHGVDRRELAVRIDAFLDEAPAPAYDEATFETFLADPLTQRIQAAVETWPTLLPERRAQVELPRSSLVRRLAEALGVGDRAEKVGDYYHRMETGTLPAEGVDRRVLEALGRLLDVTAERLRAAGERTVPPAGGGVFARSAEPLPPDAELTYRIQARQRREDADEVDRLFTGG